jgi:hypothetical protein
MVKIHFMCIFNRNTSSSQRNQPKEKGNVIRLQFLLEFLIVGFLIIINYIVVYLSIIDNKNIVIQKKDIDIHCFNS